MGLAGKYGRWQKIIWRRAIYCMWQKYTLRDRKIYWIFDMFVMPGKYGKWHAKFGSGSKCDSALLRYRSGREIWHVAGGSDVVEK